MEEEVHIWDLPYWQVLEVRSSIDVMHLTKNLCVNLLGFMGVYGKPKDTFEARQNLRCLRERDNLHPEKTDDGRHYLRPVSYTLNKEEKEIMFECLNNIKVPSGFSLNIKGIINVPEKKLCNLKFHDCHVPNPGLKDPPLVPDALWQNLLNYRAHMHLSLSNDL